MGKTIRFKEMVFELKHFRPIQFKKELDKLLNELAIEDSVYYRYELE